MSSKNKEREIYSFEKKKRLASKISDMRNKDQLKKIKNIILENNPLIAARKTSSGYLMHFQNYTNDTYYEIEKYMTKIQMDEIKKRTKIITENADQILSSVDLDIDSLSSELPVHFVHAKSNTQSTTQTQQTQQTKPTTIFSTPNLTSSSTTPTTPTTTTTTASTTSSVLTVMTPTSTDYSRTRTRLRYSNKEKRLIKRKQYDDILKNSTVESTDDYIMSSEDVSKDIDNNAEKENKKKDDKKKDDKKDENKPQHIIKTTKKTNQQNNSENAMNTMTSIFSKISIK
jgi:hypothetical protein